MKNSSDSDIKSAMALASSTYKHIEPLAKLLNTVFKDDSHLRTILMLLKAPSSISDAIFMHKFDAFYEASNLSDHNLKKLNKKLTGKHKTHFWSLIFTSIQNHDDKRRSELVGKVVVAYYKGKINYDETIRMIHASNRINVENLNYLLNCYLGDPGSMPGYALQEFFTVGLLAIDQSGIGTWSNSGGSSGTRTKFINPSTLHHYT